MSLQGWVNNYNKFVVTTKKRNWVYYSVYHYDEFISQYYRIEGGVSLPCYRIDHNKEMNYHRVGTVHIITKRSVLQ